MTKITPENTVRRSESSFWRMEATTLSFKITSWIVLDMEPSTVHSLLTWSLTFFLSAFPPFPLKGENRNLLSEFFSEARSCLWLWLWLLWLTLWLDMETSGCPECIYVSSSYSPFCCASNSSSSIRSTSFCGTPTNGAIRRLKTVENISVKQ